MHKIALALLATAALSVPAFAQAPNGTTSPQQSTSQQNTQTKNPDTMAQGTRTKQNGKMAQRRPMRAKQSQSMKQAQAEKSLAQKHYYNKASTRQMMSTRDLSRREVRSIQVALNKKGFNAGTVDGRWGPRTASALRHFEHLKGMKVTSQLSKKTISKLGLNQGQFANQRNAPTATGSSK